MRNSGSSENIERVDFKTVDPIEALQFIETSNSAFSVLGRTLQGIDAGVKATAYPLLETIA